MLINCFNRLNTGGRTIASDLSDAGFLRAVLGRTVCARLLTDRRCRVLCKFARANTNIEEKKVFLHFLCSKFELVIFDFLRTLMYCAFFETDEIHYFFFFIKNKRIIVTLQRSKEMCRTREIHLRMRGILSHQDVILSLWIAPSDQVRKQICARRRPKSLLCRDRFYVIRRHLCVIARKRFCEQNFSTKFLP